MEKQHAEAMAAVSSKDRLEALKQRTNVAPFSVTMLWALEQLLKRAIDLRNRSPLTEYDFVLLRALVHVIQAY
jgi:lysozyme family protein